ncbi:MAG: hypothetical protein AAGB04_03255 [Pseudomonadota bacterium]
MAGTAVALSALLLAAPTVLAADLGGSGEVYTGKYGEATPKGPSFSIIGELYGGIVTFDNSDDDLEVLDLIDTPAELWTGFRAHFGNAHALQIETFSLVQGSPNSDGNEESLTHTALGAHYIRRYDDNALGVYANLAGGGMLSDDDFTIGYTLAAQYARFFGRSTFFAQAGFYDFIDSTENNGDVLDDFLFAKVGMRYFFTRNMKVELTAAYGEGVTVDLNEVDDENDLTWAQFSAEFERQMEAYPVSFVIGYAADFVKSEDLNNGGEFDTTAHTFRVGLKLNLGGGDRTSLFKLDREGAGTFEFVDISRPVGFGTEVDNNADNAGFLNQAGTSGGSGSSGGDDDGGDGGDAGDLPGGDDGVDGAG